MGDTSELITSLHNPIVKRARRLRLRKYRTLDGAFLVEGIRPVWQALEQQAPVEALLWAPELLTSPGARERVERHRSAGGRVSALGAEAFGSLAERDHPSGIAAILRCDTKSLGDLEAAPGAFFVALETPGSPGNVGAIVRTLDATGGRALVIAGDAADPFHPRAVKASMGSLFALDVCRAAGVEEIADWCHAEGVTLVTTSAQASTELWDADLVPPLMLLLGSEREGLSPAQLERGDVAVRIPMQGSVSSLNLAVAAGVLLYELKRRRRDVGGSR